MSSWAKVFTKWWRASHTELVVPEPATEFKEVVPTPPPPDGSQHGKWQVVLVCRCGWVPRVNEDLSRHREDHVFSWEPCPSCGASGTLREITARAWCDASHQRFWWEFRR